MGKDILKKVAHHYSELLELLLSSSETPGESVGLGCLLFYGNAKFTWDEAQQFCCSQHNSTLIEILTEDQLSFIELYLELFYEVLPFLNTWWTGGVARGSEADWVYVSSSQPVPDFVWGEGHPSTRGDCMVLDKQNHRGQDISCNNQYYALCQLS